MSALLEVRGLSTCFKVEGGEFTAVDDISFSVQAGRTLGIVGESGCGKSVTSLSIMGQQAVFRTRRVGRLPAVRPRQH